MNILITGGNGYVGKSLYSALKNKYNVTKITRQDFDLTDSEKVCLFFKDKYFDIILHCAITGGHRAKKDGVNVLEDNLKMFYNVTSPNKFKKFINFGSGAELYLKDEMYGLSKSIIRKSVLHKYNYYNIRMFGVFDENELDTRFIKASIKHYINKESIIIHQNRLMDFIYMPDLVKIVEYYINNDGPKEIDCVYNKSLTLEKITRVINKLEEYKVDVEIINKGVDKPYIGTFNNLEINFIGLEQGIKEVYNKLK